MKGKEAFVVSLPKRTVTLPAEFFASFRGALVGCFEEDKKEEHGLPHRGAAAAAAADDWADVEMDKATGKADVIEKSGLAASGGGGGGAQYKVDFLPDVNSLPRPDELFLRPPYHLIIQDLGRQRIEISCSHTPSLQLLAEYLKRWCRINHNDSRKVRTYLSPAIFQYKGQR